MAKSLRTPLKNVRHLGSAKEGTDHFWLQRVTAVANLVMAPLFVWLVVSLIGSGHADVIATLKNPVVGLFLLLFLISGIVHMRVGMQVIIEDYVHSECRKIPLLMLNTFFAVVVGAACVFAVLKIALGA
jgi:succinate dehydrogenase / fumarate reductase, membrane anchor subunit